MLNVEKIAAALSGLGAVGIAALHETSGPAVIFVTEGGKAYRVDYAQAPDDETLTKSAKAIEDIAGDKVECAHPTRAEPERAKAIEEAQAAGRKAAAESAKSDPPPVKVQSAAEAQSDRDHAAAKGAAPRVIF